MISISSLSVNNYNSYGKKASAVRFSGEDISELLANGDKALNENKLDEALSSYQQAAGRKPEDISVLRKLGKTYHALKQYDNAIGSFSKYLEQNPNEDEVWIELGESQRQKGLYNAAIASFERAASLDDKNDLAKRSLAETKNNILSIYNPQQARNDKEKQAAQNLQEALKMTIDYLGVDYMKDLADVQIAFGETASMNGTSNIAQYEDYKKAITVSNAYKYASPVVVAAYLVHEATHAKDKDAYTSVAEEQDAYEVATKFWINHSNGIQDPEMDYAAGLYKNSPQTLKNRVEEIYKLRDPEIEMTSPNHPPEEKKHFWQLFKTQKVASQPIKEYSAIA